MRDGVFVPIETLYANQWHLQLLGGIERIWSEYRGAGVTVAVYDSGVQYTHYDLDGNYDTSLHIVVNGVVRDGFAGNDAGDSAHGTSCAGIIAADGDGIGLIGVAFEATLAGVNFNGIGGLGGTNLESEALAEMDNFDVVNLSLALRTSAFGDNFLTPGELTADGAAVKHVADAGRGGLGTNMVVAASNLWEQDDRAYHGDPNHYNLQNSRYTISVAAYADAGFVSTYSSRGAANLVAAPSNGSLDESLGLEGILTTDFLGAAGESLLDITTEFGGTSASAPIVSGVVALMLDANPNLGWRDVQEILAVSAQHVGSGLTSPPAFTEVYGWDVNGARNWNGGGMHFSNDYGFGAVDAYAAVRMAEAWSLLGPAKTSANEASTATPITTINLATSNTATVGRNFNVAGNIEIDRVAVGVLFTHPDYTDIRIELVSPDGTRSIIQDFTQSTGFGASIPDIADNGLTWIYTSNAFRSETSAGTWRIEIIDAGVTFDNAATGVLNQVQLSFFGDARDAKDVYHFTQEIAELIPLNPARRLVTDTDGGSDWLNFASFEIDMSVDLVRGGRNFGGDFQVARIGTTTDIENVVTGDGDDEIFGSGLANSIASMRGGDDIHGAAGNDTLQGGAGSDNVFGDAGRDRLTGGTGFDDLNGGVGNDNLNGGAGRDYLLGGAGADSLTGGTQLDMFVYQTPFQSGIGLAARDRILDFSHAQGDRIDVSLIDAKSAVAGDQAFVRGALANGQAGRLATSNLSATTSLLKFDIDGNGVADFEIQVTRGAIALVAADFIL